MFSRSGGKEKPMTHSSRLDDPRYATKAWARYRRILCWMSFTAFIVAALSLWWLNNVTDGLTWIEAVIIGVGIAVTIIVTAALMGLVFLSSGTGHDEQIEDPFKDLVDD